MTDEPDSLLDVILKVRKEHEAGQPTADKPDGETDNPVDSESEPVADASA